MKDPLFPTLKLIFCTFLLLASNILFASNTDSIKTWDALLKTFKTEKLSLSFVNPHIDTTVVNQVEIMDFRPDTNHVGMFVNSFSNPVKIVFANGSTLSQVIEDKLSNINNQGCSVLLIVKDLWMLNIKQNLLDSLDYKSIKFASSKLVLNIDVFLKENDQYYPLVRVDTTLWDKKVITTSSRTLFEIALEEIHLKIKEAYTKALYTKRKKENKSTIVDFYTTRLISKPFNAQPLKKGIFLSFEQFKKNETVDLNFEIRLVKDQPATLFLVDSKGNYALERKVWGVFDGKDSYIMDDDLLFKLYKSTQACYWIGFKEYDRKTYVAPAAVPLGGGWTAVGLDRVAPSTKIKLTPKLLNMITGKEY